MRPEWKQNGVTLNLVKTTKKEIGNQQVFTFFHPSKTDIVILHQPCGQKKQM